MLARIQQLTCWCAVLAFLAGCGGKAVNYEDPTALPFVECTVKIGGQQVEGAQLALHSAAGPKREIVGRFDPESGNYGFITTEAGVKKGGVPEGEYTLTVKPGPSTKVKIPAKYADPAKSDLKVQIKAGKNLLPPFELTT